MFQCLGLGTVEDGGCGEDWWHAECIVGLPRGWYKTDAPKEVQTELKEHTNGAAISEANGTTNGTSIEANRTTSLPVIGEDAEMGDQLDEDPPLPPGFPKEDDFEAFICYKCVNAFPWIKRYASTEGFLPAVLHQTKAVEAPVAEGIAAPKAADPALVAEPSIDSRKRKASEEPSDDPTSAPVKRQRSSDGEAQPTITESTTTTTTKSNCLYESLPSPPSGPYSLFLKEDFRSTLCRCPKHFPLLTPHPALLDEEDTYEPPRSGSGDDNPTNGSVGSRSLLDMGEAALSNVDRVRAIEGVMVYNHLKDKVKGFLKPFADSGVPVGAEDIKRYFEQLRGEGEVMKEMRGKLGEGAGASGDGGSGDTRREQGGY
jgi:E3 ubiquitin-protein ligase UBR7